MLLSRFWYVFLALAAGAATAAAMLSQAVINARADEALAETLQRDRTMIDAMLRLEARSRLDRLAFISVDSKLGGLLKQAQGVTEEKRLRDLNNAVKEQLHAHVLRMAEAAGASDEGSAGQRQKEVDPDIAFALDSDGRIIGQLGPMESNPAGASLVTFPLVKRALQGYVRDDVWIYDRRVYRVAARPVMSGTDYAGAIVHGYRLEKGLPEKASAYLGGATVGFFYGGDMLGSYVPSSPGAPPPGDLASALGPAQASKKLKAGESSDIIALAGGGRALFAPITGSASVAGVGYAIARPRKLLGSPQQLFEQASADDVRALPMPVLGAGALVLALIGLLFVYLEHDQHMKQLLGKTGQIAAGERDRLIVSEWRGVYRKLADGINRAIDKEVEKAGERAPVARKKANLDEILGPTPEASGTPFFGFAGGETTADAPSPPAKTPLAHPKPQTSAAPKLPAPSPRAQMAAPVPAALHVPPPVAPPAPRSPSPPASAAKEDGAAFDEDAHFREVYQEYVATRKQCGESIDNLSFEKFGVTLRKTRDQIVEKQGVKLVRFSVQIKEGKAALKAQPFKR